MAGDDEDTIESLREKVAEQEEEFLEFQNDSHALEQELEAELAEARTKLDDLLRKCDRLAKDAETKTQALNILQKEHACLNRDHTRLHEENTSLLHQLRKLEQDNDAVGQSRRAAESNADHASASLHEALERVVLLEQETSDLQRKVMERDQRYKENVRDLEIELQRMYRHPPHVSLKTTATATATVRTAGEGQTVQPLLRRPSGTTTAPPVINENGGGEDDVRYGQAPAAEDGEAGRAATLRDVCHVFCLWLRCSPRHPMPTSPLNTRKGAKTYT